MKISGKIIALTFGLGFFLGLALTSCQKDDVSRIVRHGKWEVTKFSENDFDETFQFKGYVFEFERNDLVKAVRSNSTAIGSWTTGSDYTSKDLYLDFGSNVPLNELTEVWHVMESTGSQIRLQHVDGGTDLLTFKKL